MDLLTVSGISKQHQGDLVLKEVSFTQQKFQKMAVAGETGSGKSTMLKIIAGLIQPDAGEVYFEQERVLGPEEKLLPGHPAIAYLSQHFELRNNYRVEELLEMANKLLDHEAKTIFEVCRISHLLRRWTNELSGGEKQRIALARLLISCPKLLLLDEPFSNLDMIHKSILKSVIRDISERLNITCTLISHDPLDILSWADIIIVMKEGEILQTGSPEQIYRQPADGYVASLFGTCNLIDAEQARAFYTQTKIVSNGKRLLIRPEHFKIAAEESDTSIKGEVQRVNFFGSYYEVEVSIAGHTIILRTKDRRTEGEIVYILLSQDGLCYV